jgi:hypothetical protein
MNVWDTAKFYENVKGYITDGVFFIHFRICTTAAQKRFPSPFSSLAKVKIWGSAGLTDLALTKVYTRRCKGRRTVFAVIARGLQDQLRQT